MLGFWDAVVILVLIFVLGGTGQKIGSGILSYIRILRSARRLDLRDKGYIAAWMHSDCETLLRVGIAKDRVAHQYCWRCECIIDGYDDPDPKDKEDLPAENEGSSVQSETEVADLNRYRQRKKVA